MFIASGKLNVSLIFPLTAQASVPALAIARDWNGQLS